MPPSDSAALHFVKTAETGDPPATASPGLAPETLASSLASAPARSCAGPRYRRAHRTKSQPSQPRHPQGRAGILCGRHGNARPRDPGQVCFFDFQVSAQKSVSIMAITLGDERLVEGHRRAADRAFAELERFAATRANTGLEQHNRVTGNVCAARFSHTASRALDPQLHEHNVTVNGTYDAASGQWRALTEKEMLGAVRYAGKVYQNELAGEVRRLGYELEEIRDKQGAISGFEIKGVNASVRERFSKRRADVERGIAAFTREHGRAPTPAETHVITTQTRNAKLTEASTAQVVRWQRAELSAEELRGLEKLKRDAMSRAQRMAEIRAGNPVVPIPQGQLAGTIR